MVALNSQAVELNDLIKKMSPTVYDLLSERGRAIYYPRKGILAQGAAARDKDINATIGTAYEDDGSPMVLPSIAGRVSINARDAFPYAPSEGVKSLRERWQSLIRSKNPSLGGAEISLPVVTCGVTHGLSMVGYMFTGEKDSVMLPDLYWENYDLVFTNAFGAGIKCFNFFSNGALDCDSLREALNSGRTGKKILVLNFPNNPSGYSPTVKEGQRIAEVVGESAKAGNKILAILDDSYFGLVFEDGIITESLFAGLANLHENVLAVKVDGITKEEYAWGLRVGFVTFGIKNGSRQLYSALEDKMSGAVRGTISNAPHLSQSLFLQSLASSSHDKEKAANRERIRQRYLKVKQTLAQHPEYGRYFEALPFNSGYFMCVQLRGLSGDAVWSTLLNRYSTGVICYGDRGLLRIAFASTPLDKIEKLFANIYAACKDCASQ